VETQQHIADSNPVTARVNELRAMFAKPRSSLGWLLCDRHDPNGVAFRITKGDGVLSNLTYGWLRHESNRLASALQALGVGPGDRVATLMGKSRDLLVTLMAIWKLGAVHVPLFTAFASAAVAYRLRASQAKIVVCDVNQHAKLASGEGMPAEPAWRIVTPKPNREGELSFEGLLAAGAPAFESVSLDPDNPIIEIYTSGTTGRPKGVVLPGRALASLWAYGEFGLDLRAEDVYWNVADPGWAYGLWAGVVAPLLMGVANIWLEGAFSAEATWRTLAAAGVTNLAAAPTVYRALQRCSGPPVQELRLRCASSAGEPLTPDINAWAPKALGVTVHDQYGQTETGMLINNHHHPSLRQPLKARSIGRAMPGWSLVVLKVDLDEPAVPGEVGRLAADLTCSPLAWFDGYANDPEKSAQRFSVDGRWYLTGDMAHMDADGSIFFVARDDDAILMAGYRIGPVEVEAVILEHGSVSECAVFAVPDEIRGEAVAAAVVLRPGIDGSAELAMEIQQWVKRRYAAHAYPRAVHFLATLPRTPNGKVQRFVLRQNYSCV
jgi:acetyl-CoA synthetase